MKLVLLFLIAALYSVHCTLTEEEINNKWRAFKTRYGKRYAKVHDAKFRGLTEEVFRKRVFSSKMERIKKHNERYKQGLETYKMGINHFADMTKQEMKPYTQGLVRPLVLPEATVNVTSRRSLGLERRSKIPVSLDWREKGFVTPVKNQKHCGSCWAFAAVGVLESHVKIAKGPKHEIIGSEQELVDCATKNLGCKGGWPTKAFAYVKENGISSGTKYLYTAKVGTCNRKVYAAIAKIKGFAQMTKADDENLLAEMVATKGPVAVAINAKGEGFQHYKKGIYYNPECSKKVGHAVIIVGYGSENGKDYWIVKNSWGPDWGDKGYIKMARNKNNHCGIATEASHPLV